MNQVVLIITFLCGFCYYLNCERIFTEELYILILGKPITSVRKDLINLLVKQHYKWMSQTVLTGNNGRCVQN